MVLNWLRVIKIFIRKGRIIDMTIRVNPNKNIVLEIREKIKNNGGYCPCKLEKTEENKCICKEFSERNKTGYCDCGLYYKEEI